MCLSVSLLSAFFPRVNHVLLVFSIWMRPSGCGIGLDCQFDCPELSERSQI